MNSILPGIWGPSAWMMFHSITFSFPLKPTDKEKQQYLKYFECVGNVLPCDTCRQSYQQYIKSGDTQLNIDVMASRDTLTKWGWNIHNAVNKKLGIDYGVSYMDMCNKYETFRVKCDFADGIMSNDKIALAYNKVNDRTPPNVPFETAKLFIPYANKLKLYNYEQQINYYSSIKTNTNEWKNRNKNVLYIIDYMHNNGISSMINNKLTLYGLLLLSMLSSTLSSEELNKCIVRI